MMRKNPLIFTLDVANEPAFVFQAENAHAAEALVQAPRFARALGDFYAKRRKPWDVRAAVSMRPATEAEAALYQDRLAEFADVSDRVLVARLTKA